MIEVRRASGEADWQVCKAIRFEVFVDEQQVPAELELDEHDATARHWLACDERGGLGTARVVEKPGAWKVGRVAVRAVARGQGVGLALMRAIEQEARGLAVPELVLESQTHAIPFYERLGYRAEGDEYLDCGIPHRLMRVRLQAG